jgi:phosphoserine phosphatase RsbU/P
MLQAQAALAALVQREPDAAPAALWSDLNKTFFDTVRTRLRHDEHMTMSLIRYRDDGNLEVVGAHEEILLWRAATRTVEVLPLSGTWVGLSKTARAEGRKFELGVGDVMVLYTDGILEARDAAGKMLGIEALRASVESNHKRAVDEIRDAIFELTHNRRCDDDASVLVFRYTGVAQAAAA